MSEVTKPILLDETGHEIVSKLEDIREAILAEIPDGQPVRITVVSPPTKTVYEIGEEIDLTGIAVNAVFSNNVVRDVTHQCTFNPDDGDMAGGDVITVTWIWHPTEQTFTATTPIEISVPTFKVCCHYPDSFERALAAHYAGLIDLHDYWEVGDESDLMEIVGTLGGENVPTGEQVYHKYNKLVIKHKGGKKLATPISGQDECAFIIGFKWAFSEEAFPTDTTQYVNHKLTYMYDDATPFSGSWETSDIRNWCNTTLKNCELTDTTDINLMPLFKSFYNTSPDGETASSTVQTTDYFAFESEKEMYGDCDYGQSIAESSLFQFDYYKVSSNTVLYYGYAEPHLAIDWWGRSVISSSALTGKYIVTGHSTNSGSPASGGNLWAVNEALAVAPFGVV